VAVGILDSIKNLFAAKGKGRLPRVDIKKRFELIGRTGQGSMSKAWRARDYTLGRTVFLKLLDKAKTAKFEARFPGLKRPTEGTICMGLRHKNIVRTFEHGMTTGGEPYLVMELIEGMGLNFMIETKAAGLEGKRVSILVQMAEAIGYLHKAGYLHRDICPRNIMVTQDGMVKLIDFGLAIPYKPDFCKPGNRTGTPDYLAPELIKRTTTDHRVDLFAMGVTAYEVFTGELPWERAESMQTLLSHMNMPGHDPRDFQPKLDERVAKFLMKSIERNPADRYQSAEDFAEALNALPPH
jgi:eukaryotic-like serine/threonine-protein kinase